MRVSRTFVLLFSLLLVLADISYAQVASTTPTAPSVAPLGGIPAANELKLTRSLSKGMRGSDVEALQEYLLLIPHTSDELTASGYFGAITESVVRKLQEREGIMSSGTGSTGYGVVGPRTLAKINELLKRAAIPSELRIATTTLATTTRSTVSMNDSSIAAPTTATAATSSPVVAAKLAPTIDAVPPLRANGFPTGVIVATTSVIISLTTNEVAHCFWSNLPNTPYEEIATSFSSTGGTVHSSKIWSVSAGNYAFFVKCRDRAMNVNRSDYPIIFSVKQTVSGRDPNPPRIFMSFPIDNNTLTEGPIGLLAVAADNADVAIVDFFLNTENLGAEDAKPPYAVTIMLPPGAYSAFAVARDSAHNYATSAPVAFTVVQKMTPKATTSASVREMKQARSAQDSSLTTQSASAASALRGMFELFFNLLFGIRS